MDKNRVELKTRKTYSGHLLYHFRMPFTQLWQILPVFFRPFVHAIGVGFIHLQGELFNLQFDVVNGSLNKSFGLVFLWQSCLKFIDRPNEAWYHLILISMLLFALNNDFSKIIMQKPYNL